MNEQIILSMAQPYVKDGSITYSEFDKIYSMLSIKEQYAVSEILYKNGINLIDEHEQVNEEEFVLDMDDDLDNFSEDEFSDDFSDDDDDFEILYDESIFKDNGISDESVGPLQINKNIKQSNQILCSLIQQGNQQAVQDLCIKNKKLVDKYVIAYQKRYGNRLDFEDLEQVGFVGLIKAARKFDIKQGTAFSTYAVWWIKQSISREIMDNGYAIRIPVHMMERINKVIHLDNQFLNEGVEMNDRINLIANELGISEDAVKECLVLKVNYLSYASLNAPVGAEEETELGELLPEEGLPSVEEIVENKLLRELLEKAVSTLTLREQKVLRLRFGLDDNRPRTLEDVGKEFNVTRERIRQIEAKALRKLRHPSRSKSLKDYI